MVLITLSAWLLVRFVVDGISRQNARRLCGKSCSQPDAAAAYLGWDGSVASFGLVSPIFAMEFILANQKRVVNLPSGTQAEMQQYVAHRAAEGTDCISCVSPDGGLLSYGSKDERTLIQTLTQLEELDGAASVREILKDAFSIIDNNAVREKLVIEAAQIGVRAVMSEADALKSPAGKRRHLVAAVRQICSEPEPDHPQIREVVDLEVRLLEKALAALAST